MGYTVSYGDLTMLARRMFESSIEWARYQHLATTDPTSRQYNRDCWGQEVGRYNAYLDALSLITRIASMNIDAAMKKVIPADASLDSLTSYAYSLFDELGIDPED